MTDIKELIETLSARQAALTQALPSPLRLWNPKPPLRDLRGALVVGPRGVGKTTHLLEAAKEKKTLYISMDLVHVAALTLTELAEAAMELGYEGFIFDEVHVSKNWAKHLKSLYDSHPRKFFWASDSFLFSMEMKRIKGRLILWLWPELRERPFLPHQMKHRVISSSETSLWKLADLPKKERRPRK